MDLNLVVLCGRLASVPELRVFDSGSRMVRLLVTVRIEEPERRIDVVPVTAWDPDPELETVEPGRRVWVCGAVQRRFWDGSEGRRSRLEVVAHKVDVRQPDEAGEVVS